MALHDIVFVAFALSCSLFRFGVLAHIQFDQDGSTRIYKRCECDSVQFWIPRRTNRVSHLLSYEEIVSNTRNDLFSSRNDLDKGVRLWLPRHCELRLSDDNSILQRNPGIRGQNEAKKTIQVWIKNVPLLNCFTATLKCKDKTLCIGIETSKEAQSIRRRLLMSDANNREETSNAYQPYGVLISVLVFFLMIVLLALCGKTEKNSQESVARDTDGDVVKIVSSDKVENVKRTDKGDDEGGGGFEIKVEESGKMGTDSNSNNSKQLPGDVDLSLVPATGAEVQKDAGKTAVDGAVFGKVKSEERVGEASNEQGKATEGKENGADGNDREENGKFVMGIGSNLSKKNDHAHDGGKKEKRKEEKKKEKEEKVKEKDVTNKDRRKDMRSKRSNTSPESTESKTSLPKMRFSLKGSSSSTNAYEGPKAPKREKTKSKKKQDLPQPANARAPFSADRRSFINRELPKRPSEERDNPPGYDDDSGDENYEHVVVKGGPPRNPAKLEVPSQNYDNDSDLYDSVDDPKGTRPKADAGLGAEGIDQDNYEVVDTKRSKHPSAILVGKRDTSANRGEYEGPNVYEDPGMSRQRSFSDTRPGSSIPTPDAKRKTMSLERKSRQENAPTPPPLDHIQQAKRSQQMIIDDIEPYTITYKEGDRILQETSSPNQFRPIQHEEEAMDGEADLYTLVDKEKQKRDRIESASASTQEENIAQENGQIIGDIEPYTITVKKGDHILQETSSADHIKPIVVRQEELSPEEKENLYTKVDKEKQKRDRMEVECEAQKLPMGAGETNVPVEEEHQYETMPRIKANSEKILLKKMDSFEATEDVGHYEQVDTKTGKSEVLKKTFV